MAEKAAVTGQPYKNDGGTIKKGGSVNVNIGGPITKSRSLVDDAFTTPYGSVVALSSGLAGSSGNMGTFNAKTKFAYVQGKREFLIKKGAQNVNGTANVFTTSCGSSSSERMRSVAFLEGARSLGSGVSTVWDYETGRITKGTGAGELRTFGADHAARPTNAVPGELVYRTDAKLPVQDDYKPRTAP